VKDADSTVQALGQVTATAGIHLQDLDPVPWRQTFRQLLADIATPRDQDLVIRGLRGVEGADERGERLASGEEEDLILLFDHRRRPRDDDLTAAIDGHQPTGAAGNLLGKLTQGLSRHPAARLDPDHRQLNTTADEVDDLQASRLINQVCDRLGDQEFRADDMVDGDGPEREEFRMGQVMGIAYPRQPRWRLEQDMGQ